jgi:hypothetical protein
LVQIVVEAIKRDNLFHKLVIELFNAQFE